MPRGLGLLAGVVELSRSAVVPRRGATSRLKAVELAEDPDRLVAILRRLP